MRSLTISEAAASTNIWFKVESEEQQSKFQEEFFKQGGSFADMTAQVDTCADFDTYLVTKSKQLLPCVFIYSRKLVEGAEFVELIWQEELFITIASLAPEATLKATLNTSLNWQDTLALLTALKNKELAKDFISDKCLRRMEDAQLASLARFLLEKTEGYYKEEDIVKSFVLTTKNYLTKKTTQTEYWYKFYRKEVERVVRQSQAGLYQEEFKASSEWESLSWERRGEE